MKTACLIIIGNEILSGRTQDKNLAWLAQQLNSQGVRLMESRIIPDIEEVIIKTVNECRARFDVVFTTGGIGPTHDDITSGCIAKAFGAKLIRHPEAEAILRRHYTPEQINEARLKMADIPQGASLVLNPVSAAPGFKMQNVYVFAGVPSIMQAMFANMRHELGEGKPMQSRTVSAFATEGTIAGELAAIQSRYPEIEIGSYPFFKNGRLGTSLVCRGLDDASLSAAGNEVRALLVKYGEIAEGME